MRKNKKFTEVCAVLRTQMMNAIRTYPKDSEADLSDVGNEIGIVIARYFDENDIGFDKDSFLAGLNHGISLTDGTHG
jgi:hypothetical protein